MSKNQTTNKLYDSESEFDDEEDEYTLVKYKNKEYFIKNDTGDVCSVEYIEDDSTLTPGEIIGKCYDGKITLNSEKKPKLTKFAKKLRDMEHKFNKMKLENTNLRERIKTLEEENNYICGRIDQIMDSIDE